MDNTNHSNIYEQLGSSSSDPFNVLNSDIDYDSSLESSGGDEIEYEGPIPYLISVLHKMHITFKLDNAYYFLCTRFKVKRQNLRQKM